MTLTETTMMKIIGMKWKTKTEIASTSLKNIDEVTKLVEVI